MKVIIADDELKICKLIKVLVDWEKYGLEIEGVANDGQQALDMVKEKKPDIVLTDIMMPEIDGLEMIRLTREAGIDTDFVVISGYQDFEYARKAIKYGVQDFLTKPISKVELEEVLNKLIAKRQEKDKEHENIKNLRKTIEKQSQQIKNSFLRRLIDGEISEDSIYEINQKYNSSFQDGLFCFFIVKADFCETEEYEIIYKKISKKIVEICQKEFRDICFEILADVFDIGVCVFINYSQNAIGNLRGRLKHIRINSVSLHEIFGEIHVTVGVGCETDKIGLAEQSYRMAEKAILNRIYLGTDKMIGITENYAAAENLFKYLDEDYKNVFMESVNLYDTNTIDGLLDELEKVCMSNTLCDGYSVFAAIEELLRLMFFKLDINEPNVSIEVFLQKAKAELYRCADVGGVFAKAKNIIRSVIENERKKIKEINLEPIQKVKAYIQSHYKENMTLEELSKIAGFNSNYFSGMFKKETGETITEYILSVRIGRAKELLKDKNIKINEVPEKVGIGDTKYFTKQFKKVAGLTPSQYRKYFG